MEHPDLSETEDEKIARALADITESPTAIERQIAAASALRYNEQAYKNYYADRPHPVRFGIIIFFLLFFLIAAAAIFVFTDVGRPLKKTASAMLRMEQAAAPAKPLPTSSSSPTNSSAPNTTERSAPKIIGEIATPAALSVPIIDVSLRNRPELLEQLVQVYRSQLSIDSNDVAAQTALNQLREKSLSELETIVAGEDETNSIRSIELMSRLFPELADNTRYKYLIARMGHIHRETKTESPTETASTAATPATDSPTTDSPTTIAPITSAQPATAPTTTATATVPAAATSTVSSTTTPVVAKPAATRSSIQNASTIDTSSNAAKKTSENAVSSKPDIRVLSITPGALVDQRFVPSAEGKVFMVEISYRNFKNSADQSEPALVARLGVPGESMVLAEAPVDILGDRGTKSFLMEAMVPGNIGETYKLNFILDGEFLASRTIRLSASAP